MERYERYVDATTEVITHLDENGVILYESPAVERILGYQHEERTGDKVFEYIHPDDRDYVMEAFEEAVAKDEDMEEVEFRMEAADGSYVWIASVGTNVSDTENGGVVASSREISELKERKQELERFKAFVENVSEVITVTDGGGELEYVSPASRELTGYDPEEMVGEEALDFVHPGDRELAGEAVEYMKENPGEAVTREMRLENSGEGYTWVESTNINRMDDENGEGVMQVHRDIGDRKERERELKRYNGYVNSSTDIIIHMDDSGEIIYYSPAMERILGVKEEDWIGATLYDKIHPDDRKAVVEHFTKLVEDETPEIENIEFRIQHSDGPYVWLDAFGRDMTDSDIGGVIGTARDITQRKQREQKLERFETYVENTSDVIMHLDDSGSIIYNSPSVENVLGIEQDEWLGDEVFEKIHPDDRERAREELRTHIEQPEGEAQPVEFRMEHSKESYVMMESVGRRLTDSEVAGLLVVFRDITESKEREQHLRVIDHVLRHNLRNDLNLVRGYAETVREVTGEEVAGYLDGIIETSDQLLGKADKERRILDILTKSPTYEEVSLAEVVSRALEPLRSDQPEADIQVDVSESATVIVTDRFDQALTELVENAVIHNNGDTAEVEVSTSESGNELRLSVADDGPSIPEMELSVLTEDAEGPLYHGSGLGLWFVHWVVRRSRGDLSVDENDPCGNVVTITLNTDGSTQEIEDEL